MTTYTELPLQAGSLEIWDKKYRLKTKKGEPIDVDVAATQTRLAKALSEIEVSQKRNSAFKQFLWVLQQGAVPAGRIVSNAGAGAHKSNTSLINCTVSMRIKDSMAGILQSAYEAGITLASGAGIGYEFSTIRNNGAFISGVGASTSGALSFMDIHDAVCFTVSSAGGRRGK